MTCPICDQKPMNCDCTPEERRMHAEIEDLEEQMPCWIPVSERLPDDRVAVAVFVQGDHQADRSVTVAHMFQGHWRCPYFGEEFLEDVSIIMGKPTHWMPLPAPPTDGK